ncbi:SdiA-regulated domain-containing protein [Shinella sp. M27]|uniref:SdiA-regulated domain-containing protein n=1 Tax=Shinella sp. M27 TaxID=3368614 RepID=UPI003BA3971A
MPSAQMRLKPRFAFKWRLLWLAGMALVSFTLWKSAILSFGYYWILANTDHAHSIAPQINLSAYAAKTQKKVIAGLTSNVSGLTFSSSTQTLFTVINKKPAVAEISVEGDLIRRIPIISGKDPEGITHIAGDLFVIVDEGDQSIHWVNIKPETTALTLTDERRLVLNLSAYRNLGIEGVSWDSDNNRLYIVQEALPLRILVVEGLLDRMEGVSSMPTVKEWTSGDLSKVFSLDLSSVSFHEQTRSLFLLSHASSMLVNYTLDGKTLGMLALHKGRHGLDETVPQAEGVALDPKGAVYIVSEPNFFYRFERP